jgi:nucleoside-diphosphate-sugar epimerase
VKVFVTGATGYIGGTVAARLVAAGHRVRGLTRDAAKADALRAAGIDPVVGSLDDSALLVEEARAADAVVSAASADDHAPVETLLTALEGTGKAFVHTSGSSVVGDDARGARSSDAIYDEFTPLVIDPRKQARRDTDLAVLAASDRGVRAMVVCPSLVYGVGRGVNTRSIQVPFLVDEARASGVVRVVGAGLNRWSNVHIDDVADLYVRAVESGQAGAFYFAENGEASFAEIGEAIAERLGLGPIETWDPQEAAARWGEARAYFTFGGNSRVRAKRARDELGWAPQHASVEDWIRGDMPLDEGDEHGS